MDRVEPKLGEQHGRRPAKGFDTAQIERALPGPYGNAELRNTWRVVEPLFQKFQDFARDAGAMMQRFNDFGGRNQVEDSIENLLLDFRKPGSQKFLLRRESL